MQAGYTGAFATAVAATSRTVSYQLLVQWDGVNWSDESARLLPDFSGVWRIAAPGLDLIPPGDIASVTLNLDNNDGRFSWRNTGGPLAAAIASEVGLGDKAVRLSVGFVGVWCRIFTGVVASWREDDTSAVVSLNCRDMGWRYLQKKISTPLQTNILTSGYVGLLADLASIPAGEQQIETAIHYIPWAWLDDESILAEMWEAAGSEGARVWFDALGKLRFQPAPAWAANTVPVWDFGAGFVSTTGDYTTETVVSQIKAEWAAREMGGEAVLWTLDKRKTVAPGSVLTLEAQFSQPAAAVIVPASARNQDVYAASPGGAALNDYLEVALSSVFGQRAIVTLTNTHPAYTAVLHRLRIRGYPLIGSPNDQITVAASTNPLGRDRVRDLPSNPYIQTPAQALTTAAVVAEQYRRVQRAVPLQGVPGVPQLELGDRVSASLPDGSTLSGYVTEIAFRCESGGFVQDLIVLDAVSLFAYSDYFIVGATALGAVGRAWH